MSSIMVINAKGGSGKTTISTNLSSYFAINGYKVTLVDLDPQGSSTKWLSSRPFTKPKIKGLHHYRIIRCLKKMMMLLFSMFPQLYMALGFKHILRKQKNYYPCFAITN